MSAAFVAYVWHGSTADTKIVPIIDHCGHPTGACGYMAMFAPPASLSPCAACILCRHGLDREKCWRCAEADRRAMPQCPSCGSIVNLQHDWGTRWFCRNCGRKFVGPA